MDQESLLHSKTRNDSIFMNQEYIFVIYCTYFIPADNGVSFLQPLKP